MTRTQRRKRWEAEQEARLDRQQARNMAGTPCYCGSLADGWCDFCSGLAPEGGSRWQDALKELNPR